MPAPVLPGVGGNASRADVLLRQPARSGAVVFGIKLDADVIAPRAVRGYACGA